MVLLVICAACKRGQHDYCAGDRPAPKGVLGGTACTCDCRKDT